MMRVPTNFAIAIIVVLIGAAAASAAVELNLRERVVLKSSIVRLADVAEIVTADGELETQLATLPLMPAPASGTQRFLPKREIADLLAARGLDLHGVRFGGAAQVEMIADGDGWKKSESATAAAPPGPMNRHAAILAEQAGGSSTPMVDASRADELRDELRHMIVNYLSTKVGQAATWRVSCDVAERHLALFAAATSAPVCQGGNAPWTGRQRFVVSFSTREGAVQVPIYAEVDAASAPVVVAVRPIARGDVITAAQLELRSVDHIPQASHRRSAVDSIDTLIGMEARQAIQAGDVIFSDQVQAPVLVKRGEVITVSSQAGGIRVRTTVRAREDGARGDLVQVESLETRERFDVRVVGPREAAIFAQSRPVKAEPAERVETARRSQ